MSAITWGDAFGFVAMASNVLGNIMLTGKSVSGWWIRLFSITFWGAYGVWLFSWPIMINAVIFTMINCLGIYRWHKDAQQAAS